MEYRVVAVDLDGTALLEDGKTISARVARALLAAHRLGVAIVPITGRPFEMLPAAIRDGVEWEELCVLCNGGEIRSLPSGKLLDTRYMEGHTLLPLLALAARLDLPVEVFTPDAIYLTRECWDRLLLSNDSALSFHLSTVLPTLGHAVPALEPLCGRAGSLFRKALLPAVPDRCRDEVVAELEGMPLSFAWSGSHSIEITHAEATKAKGLKRVCRLLDIELEQTMAIGDSGNDIPMLREAGLGVAMGNAPPPVKVAANVVTGTNIQDGVATAIERHILGEALGKAR